MELFPGDLILAGLLRPELIFFFAWAGRYEMDAQSSEFRPDIRIKFASIDRDGAYVSDSNREYETFFNDLPEPWIETDTLLIKTRYEWERRARVLKNDKGVEIAAVEHETGIEVIAVTFAVAVAAKLTADAISGFVKWGWRKWRETRQELIKREPAFTKVESPSLLVEVLTAKGVDGRSETRTTMSFSGPVADDDIPKCLEQAFAKMGQ